MCGDLNSQNFHLQDHFWKKQGLLKYVDISQEVESSFSFLKRGGETGEGEKALNFKGHL